MALEAVQSTFDVGAPMHGRSDGVTLVLLQAALAVLAAASAIAVVRDVQRRQDEQWKDRARRARVPRPSADTLR
jgi:hypothetical protein